jgi:hypothetical protein
MSLRVAGFLTCHCEADGVRRSNRSTELTTKSQDRFGTGSTILITKNEIPRGVYPEKKDEILSLCFSQGLGSHAQNDKRRALKTGFGKPPTELEKMIE